MAAEAEAEAEVEMQQPVAQRARIAEPEAGEALDRPAFEKATSDWREAVPPAAAPSQQPATLAPLAPSSSRLLHGAVLHWILIGLIHWAGLD